MSVETAVILAAGMGKRLEGFIDNIPKGFIVLDGMSLIERSVSLLKKHGIKKIIIVTGFMASKYDDFSSKVKGVETVKNLKYAESGSMYSLFEARNQIKGDFLLLESDLVYEERAIKVLLESHLDTAVLLSGKTQSQDEVYVEVENNRIVNITKNKNNISNLAGELVGISKISQHFFNEMQKEVIPFFENNLHLDYEVDGIVMTSKNRVPAKIIKIEDLLWAEIDNKELYIRARDEIIPKINLKNRNKD